MGFLTLNLKCLKCDDLQARVNALEALLKGVERTQSPDGIEGLYFPFRIGIQSKWNNNQPMGEGTALTVATGVDKVAVLIQHDGAEGSDGLGKDAPEERTALKILSTDPHADNKGINRGIVVIAANAPTNIGVDAYAQYGTATHLVEIVKETEWKN